MDDRLRRRIRELSSQLALEEKEQLEAAGTLVDWERLTMQIGDELACQLAQAMLSERAQEAVQRQTHCCPERGTQCPVEADLEPLILQGMRGEITDQEPRCHCSRCRRAFFPMARDLQRAPRENVTPLVLEKTTHWREDKVGLVLSMPSEVHAQDPCPEFPVWLASARVVAEMAQLDDSQAAFQPDDAHPGSDARPQRRLAGGCRPERPRGLRTAGGLDLAGADGAGD